MSKPKFIVFRCSTCGAINIWPYYESDGHVCSECGGLLVAIYETDYIRDVLVRYSNYNPKAIDGMLSSIGKEKEPSTTRDRRSVKLPDPPTPPKRKPLRNIRREKLLRQLTIVPESKCQYRLNLSKCTTMK